MTNETEKDETERDTQENLLAKRVDEHPVDGIEAASSVVASAQPESDGEPAKALRAAEEEAEPDKMEAEKAAVSNPDDAPAGENVDSDPAEAPVEEKALPERKKLSPQAVKLVENFAACGRCSFFLAGYRVLQGEEGLELALSQTEDEQMPLVWTYDMRDLVVRSYGTRFDGSYLHLNGSCPECGRPFTYSHEAEDETEPQIESFTIQYRTKKK